MADLFSCEAEQAVLGGLMVSPVAFADVAALLTPADFFLEFHRRLFTAMVALHQDQQPIDPLTVAERLESQHQLTPVEFASTAAMANDTPSAANVLAYAGLVRSYARRRALLGLADQLATWTRDERDADRVIARLRAALERLETGQDRTGPRRLADLLPGVLTDLDSRAHHTKGLLGLSSGLPDVDRLLDGFCPGRLYVIAGRPGSGKSVFALNAVRAALEAGKTALLFTLEMPASEAIHRLLAAEVPLPLGELQAARLSGEDWTALTDTAVRVGPRPLWLDDSGQLSISDLLARARRIHRLAPLSLIVVDYIGLVDGERNGNASNRVQEIGSITRALKQLAKELSVPVLALSQLNRTLEQRADKRPILSDLRESGSVEQDADVVAFVYRDELHDSDSPDQGCAEWIVRKNRSGRVGVIPLRFDAEHCRFQSLEGPLPSWGQSSTETRRRGFRRHEGGA